MTLPIFPVLRGLTWPVLKSSEFDTLIQASANKMETRIAQTYNPVWRWEMIWDVLVDDPFNIQSGFADTDYRTLQGFVLSMHGQFGDFLFDDPTDNYVGPAALQGSASPNIWNQLQLVNDGAGNYYSPLQRNFGGQFYEDITDLNGSALVWANGTLKTPATDYFIVGPGIALPGCSFMGLVISWASPPAWAPSHLYALGAEVLDAAGHIQMATTSGNSGITSPQFNDSASTTSDGAVIWTDQGYNPGPTGPITAAFSYYFRVHFGVDAADFEQFLSALWTLGGSEGQKGSGSIKICSSRVPQI